MVFSCLGHLTIPAELYCSYVCTTFGKLYGLDPMRIHHSDEGVAGQARDDGVAGGVEGAAGRAVGGGGQNGRPRVDCASGRSDEGVSPGGDNADDDSVLKGTLA
jgi:hypothetical protein